MIFRIIRQISPPPFWIFGGQKFREGLIRRTQDEDSYFRNQNFCMTLDDVAFDFLFEEVSEPEEMTDDDSNFSPSWELKIEFKPRKFIHFTLFEVFFSFTFLDLTGGLIWRTYRKSTISLSKLGRGSYTEGGRLFAGIYGKSIFSDVIRFKSNWF